MSKFEPIEITRILHEWNGGDDAAGERLFQLIYLELKQKARSLMSQERSEHTLQPTALVHEAFLRLTGLNEIKWNDRKHFFRFVSQVMRRVLVDYARQKASDKRGNRQVLFSVDDLQIPVGERADALVRLDDALNDLAKIDGRRSQIVEMRYFGGMKNSEIAEMFEISERTVGREWREAKFWLFRELNK